ncbi:MAG: NAD(P)H-dependent oxidoreductase subunit E [Chitinophagales bacterium]|nr:NAD(P)H-dependent oxidoreductase subunit E [Chitinophagales bacterium]MDW8428223.1 NAD(P)H-dependent oxidoreductase subunit E [Chitinophagales bacterium]
MLAVRRGKKVEFSPEVLEQAQQIIRRYPEGQQKSALIPLLHLAQEQFGGYLSVEAMDYIAELLHLKPIEVYEVATFYSMFHLKPVGRYVLEVCHTGPCEIKGAEWLIQTLKKKLGIQEGETTADGLFTLRRVECLAACGYAPMLQCGERYYEFLDTEEKVDALLEQLRQNAIT